MITIDLSWHLFRDDIVVRFDAFFFFFSLNFIPTLSKSQITICYFLKIPKHPLKVYDNATQIAIVFVFFNL